MSNAKHWMFTINNPTVEADHQILNLPCKYCIYSYEQAASGTVHIQGYVSFSGCKKLSVLTKALPGAHFEVRRGSHSQAKAYCSKVDDDSFTINKVWGYQWKLWDNANKKMQYIVTGKRTIKKYTP